MATTVTIHTAIISAPRPRPTLDQSIGSFRRAGFSGDVLVCSDGGDPVIDDGVITLVNEVKLGNKRNWIRALSLVERDARQRAGDQWLMVCEDDILWQAGAATTLVTDLALLQNSAKLHMVGGLSLFACRKMTMHAERARGGMKLGDGWHWDNMQFGKKTWGAQCLLFNQEMAKWLLSNEDFRNYAQRDDMDKNIDLIVGESLNRSGRKILYRVPSLVNHRLGDKNSSLYGDRERPNLITDYFRGPEA